MCDHEDVSNAIYMTELPRWARRSLNMTRHVGNRVIHEQNVIEGLNKQSRALFTPSCAYTPGCGGPSLSYSDIYHSGNLPPSQSAMAIHNLLQHGAFAKGLEKL